MSLRELDWDDVVEQERAERARYEGDDRTQCKCYHREMSAFVPPDGPLTRCLVSTRHPSGYCYDCRPYEVDKEEED